MESLLQACYANEQLTVSPFTTNDEERNRRFIAFLSNTVSILNSSIARAQSRFVEFGAALQILYRESDSVAADTKKYAEMLGDSGVRSIFGEISESAAVTTETLRRGLEKNRGLLLHIQDVVEVVRTLSRSVESIEAVGARLSIIGTNFAIQTSKLEAGAESFGDFSSEIKSFSAYIRRMTESIERDTEEVILVLSAVKERMESKLAAMESTIGRAEKSSKEAISQIEAIIAQSSEMILSRQGHSEEISKYTGSAIVAIQVDDIARQRLEHVVDALQKIVSSGSLPAERMVLKVQASQVLEVSCDLKEAFEMISKAFADIGSATERIAPASSSEETNFQSASASLKRLQRVVLELENIRAEGDALSKSMSEGLDRAIGVSEAISQHIGDVSGITQELNLKAINALLMSRQWGGMGGNLVVLAKELHTLSKESIEFVTVVQNKIEHVSQVTTALKNKALIDATGMSDDNRFEEQIGVVNEIVSIIEDASDQAAQKAERLQRYLLDTEAELPFILDFSSQLETCAQEIDKSIPALPSATSTNSKDEDSTLFENYTMERERRLHRAIRGENQTQSFEGSENPSNDDDILGDFELF
jgi:hypothetical protein